MDFTAFYNEEKNLVDSSSEQWTKHGHAVAKLLIKCAVLAYSPESAIREEITGLNKNVIFTETGKEKNQVLQGTIKEGTSDFIAFQYFNAEGSGVDTHAFGIVLENDIILSFRGTVGFRNVFSDMDFDRKPLTDFDGSTQPKHQDGNAQDDKTPMSLEGIEVHDGFLKCLDSIWSKIGNNNVGRDDKSSKYKMEQGGNEEIMSVQAFLDTHAKTDNNEKRTIWLTGHSMGAAMATIAAARIEGSSKYCGQVGGLFTIGSPRVMNKKGAVNLVESLGIENIYRIVKHIDPVPLLSRFFYFNKYVHVNGVAAVVTNSGDLFVGKKGLKSWFVKFLSRFRMLEDLIGLILPGKHADASHMFEGHRAAEYLSAVNAWNPDNSYKNLEICAMLWSPIKILGLIWSGTLLSPYWLTIKNFVISIGA